MHLGYNVSVTTKDGNGRSFMIYILKFMKPYRVIVPT